MCSVLHHHITTYHLHRNLSWARHLIALLPDAGLLSVLTAIEIQDSLRLDVPDEV